MTRTLRAISIAALIPSLSPGLPAGAEDWSPTTWKGEPALSSTVAGWRAIVSVARGRLVHFGRDETGRNLLFAPAVAEGWFWGGHRVWLGPQSTWDEGWPPPDAWEAAAATEVRHENGGITLVMPPSPGKWGDLVRSYRWDGEMLLCGARFTGAERDAQIVHILQLDPAFEVEAQPIVSDTAQRGYVLLPADGRTALQTTFDPPPHVVSVGDGLRIRHLPTVEKLGFRPQLLRAHLDGITVELARHAIEGRTVADPDLGFHTQVYLGGGEPFVEIEQLSPVLSGGDSARFVVSLRGRLDR